MTWRVKLTSRAELQLYESALWWAENRSTDQAVRWMEQFQAAIERLAENADQWRSHRKAIICQLMRGNLSSV